jgi:hypothetical protein
MQQVVIIEQRGNVPGQGAHFAFPETRSKNLFAIGEPATLGQLHQSLQVVKRVGFLVLKSFLIELAQGVYPSYGAAFAGLLFIHAGTGQGEFLTLYFIISALDPQASFAG